MTQAGQMTMKFTAKQFGPLARNSDEDTSQEQAAVMIESGKAESQARWVASWVHKKPGRTFMELAAIAAKSEKSVKFKEYCEIFWKRLSFAENKLDLIKRGPKRRCGVNEIRKLTWWPN